MDARAALIRDVYEARYTRYRHAIAAIAGGYEGAHDAVQDGFARALAHRHEFRGGSLEAWIWRIVVRQALDQARGPKAMPVEERLDAALIESERDPELVRAIRALPPRRRLIVFLRYFADLSYREIATVCAISDGTVAATLAQAHAELREALELEGVEQ